MKFRIRPCGTIFSNVNLSRCTILPAKSDSDATFCLQSYQGLRIDRSLEQDRINTLSVDSHQPKWSVKVNVLLNNCKQNTTSLSLLAGTTVGLVTKM